MPYISDLASSGLDKIISRLEYSEIQNKDFVIPKDRLYIYINILERIQRNLLGKAGQTVS